MTHDSPDAIYAVLTGDVVDSSKIPQEHRSKLQEMLENAFRELETRASAVGFDVYRGDSFQGVLEEPRQALRAALLIRSRLRKHQPPKSDVSWDARIAMGIGPIDHLPENVGAGDGAAYRRSGPSLDAMKGDEKLAVRTPWEDVDEELEPPAALLDAVIAKWSPGQGEVVLELLRGRSRREIGEAFGISQAAVHYRVKGAGWFAVEKFIDRYESVIEAKLKP